MHPRRQRRLQVMRVRCYCLAGHALAACPLCHKLAEVLCMPPPQAPRMAQA